MARNVDNGINYIMNNDTVNGDYISKVSQGSNRYSGQSTGNAMLTTSLDDLLGYRYAHEDTSGILAKTTKENFDEYIKNREAKKQQEGIDDASKEKQERENAKEITRNLSPEEIEQLRMMGVDVDSAKLSDIMGMVNTMRGNAHREETAELLAKISASSGDVSDLSIVGGGVKIAGSDVLVQGLDISDVLAAESSDEAEMKSESFTLSNDELIYLLKNNLPVTKENMYKAHFSGSKAGCESLPQDIFDDMMPQIEKAIEQAGYEVNEKSISGAKLLINNNLPVTPDTMNTYMQYQDSIGKDIHETVLPDTEKEAIAERANELYRTVKGIMPEAVFRMAMEERTVTIAAAAAYLQKTGGEISGSKKAVSEYTKIFENNKESSTEVNEKELAAVTAMRQMEEIRLSMTQEAAFRLVKSDFNIDTKELSKVVNELRNMEQAMIESKLRHAGVENTAENISLYKEITDKVQGLSSLPAAALGAPLVETEEKVSTPFSVNGLHEAGQEISRRAGGSSFETIRKSYEAVGTAPRADMGDSIQKAFANVDDILEDYNIPITPASERAVRILGYNSIEITPDNINQIMDYDRQVNELMNSFYPEAVLSMIKDGINPLDVPIDQLNQVIRRKNYNAGVSDAENFATYLRDMEKLGNVSEKERESYIGIYRVMNKLAKSGDREAGYLFANGTRLTVRNLITAMRSRRAKGLDVSVDDDFGMLEDIAVSGKRMDEQIEKAFALDINTKKDIEKRLNRMTEEVEQYMVNNNIEVSLVNASAVSEMLSRDNGLYGLVYDVLSKLKFKTNIEENLVDEETGNMAASLAGEDIPYDFTPDSILESLMGSDSMSLKYEDLRDQLTELMLDAGLTGNVSELELASIKTLQAGFNILSSMASCDKYQVPVQTEQGVKVMNLTVKHDEEKRGSIEIFVNGNEMGRVSAHLKISGEGRPVGYIVSDTGDGNYRLIEAGDTLFEKLKESGIDASGVQVGSIAVVRDHQAIETVSREEFAKDIYQTSVAFVKAIGGILK